MSSLPAQAGSAPPRPPACPCCSRPVPPPLEPLPALVLGQLDVEGPASSRRLAGALHRRAADVRGALHELAAAGVVRLEQPTGSTRSQRWTVVSEARGRGWDAHGGTSGGEDGFAVAGAVVAALAALTGSGGWPRRLVLAAALAAALVLLGGLAAREGAARA
ncbi:MAG TPA: hypothetical protein VFA88_06755 [Gaiellaceae bacterium]|nr:hypothetical protein [Gaiellaceae bacterium]